MTTSVPRDRLLIDGDDRIGGRETILTTVMTSSANVNATNLISSPVICPPLRSTALNVMAAMLGVCVITGNGLVMLAILGGRSRLFRPMYWFIVHISLSDFLLGIMLLWNYCLMSLLNINNTINSLIVIHSFWLVSACASVLGILLLALDRYMQVVHRDFHRIYFNQLTVGLSIFLCWIIPLLLYMLPPLALDASCKGGCRCEESRFMECKPVHECSLIIPPFKKSLVRSAAVFLYVVMPCPIVIYCAIFYKVRKQTQLFHQRMRKRDVRLIKTLVAIMAIFVVTLLPTGVVLMVDATSVSTDPSLISMGLGAFVVATLNSLANPILYIWRIAAIRTSLQRQLPFLRTPSNLNQRGGTLNNNNGHLNRKVASICVSKPHTSRSRDSYGNDLSSVRAGAQSSNATGEGGSRGGGEAKQRRKSSWMVLFTRVAFNGASSQESTPDFNARRHRSGSTAEATAGNDGRIVKTSSRRKRKRTLRREALERRRRRRGHKEEEEDMSGRVARDTEDEDEEEEGALSAPAPSTSSSLTTTATKEENPDHQRPRADENRKAKTSDKTRGKMRRETSFQLHPGGKEDRGTSEEQEEKLLKI